MTAVPRAGAAVSIVIPCLNPGPQIVDALESVLREADDVEVLVQDGGSGSDALRWLDPYREFVSVVSEPDSGQSQALNRGIARASGDFIGWLNADDFYVPGWRSAVRDAVAKLPRSELIYGDFGLVDAVGSSLRSYEVSTIDRGRLLRRGCYLFSGATFFRRDLFTKHGFFREDLHYSMDYEMFVRLAGSVVATKVPRILGMLRIHDDSKTGSRSLGFLNESAEIVLTYAHGPRGVALAARRWGEQGLLQLVQPLRYGPTWSRVRHSKRL